MPPIPNKMFFRLGEVMEITGFNKAAILKFKEAGTLTPRRFKGYLWDCYPREQIVKLVGTETQTQTK